MVLDIVKDECQGLGIRERGGVYFIPATHEATFAKLQALFAGFPGCAIDVIPVIDTAQAKKSTWKAFAGDVTNEIESLRADLETFDPTDTTAGRAQRGIETRLEKYRALKNKIENYEILLNGKATDLTKALADLTNKLRDIAELMGRFRNIVNAAAATTPSHGYDEIVDIGIGNDVSRLVPSEIVKLVTQPELFYVDFLEGKLLQYELRGTENLGKGPIIACMDISDSMNDNGREQWAKAVVLSLQALSEKQKRTFACLPFNTNVQAEHVFKKGASVSIQDKIAIAQISSNGGTNFYRPLKRAFELRQEEKDLHPADIVFITDGDCQLTEAQLAEIAELKKATNVRIFGVAINIGGYGCDGSSLTFCDSVITVNSAGEINDLKSIVGATASA